MMDCPKCMQELRITHKEGIEIDYCPNCRGVWLDRGELEKLIAFSATAYEPARPIEAPRAPMPPVAPMPPAYPPHGYAQPAPNPGYYRSSDDYYRKHGHYRKKSPLGKIFDIFD